MENRSRSPDDLQSLLEEVRDIANEVLAEQHTSAPSVYFPGFELPAPVHYTQIMSRLLSSDDLAFLERLGAGWKRLFWTRRVRVLAFRSYLYRLRAEIRSFQIEQRRILLRGDWDQLRTILHDALFFQRRILWLSAASWLFQLGFRVTTRPAIADLRGRLLQPLYPTIAA